MGNLIPSRSEAVGVPNNPEASFWCRSLARAMAVFASIICMLTGLATMISTSPTCIIAGILMILLGGIVLVFEAPICFTFVEATKPIASFAEKRTFFQKAILYVVSAIIPILMCFGVATMIGCGLVFAAGVFYGLMGLGKKADREQMMESAATTNTAHMATTPTSPSQGPKAALFENQETYPPPSNRPF